MNLGVPIVILEGSDFANEVFALKEEFDNNEAEQKEFNTFYAPRKEVQRRLAASKFIRCKESSEDLASIVHLLLAVSIF